MSINIRFYFNCRLLTVQEVTYLHGVRMAVEHGFYFSIILQERTLNTSFVIPPAVQECKG
jgi:hypothetical protein